MIQANIMGFSKLAEETTPVHVPLAGSLGLVTRRWSCLEFSMFLDTIFARALYATSNMISSDPELCVVMYMIYLMLSLIFFFLASSSC